MNDMTWIDGPPTERGPQWLRTLDGREFITVVADPKNWQGVLAHCLAHCPIPKPVDPPPKQVPVPRYVPLDDTDWDSSPVWWVRAKGSSDHKMVVGINETGIDLARCSGTYLALQVSEFERSPDRIHWSPCHKEAA